MYKPKPNKSLGQHWLVDEPSLKLIASLAKLKSSDTVLEIGPGLGNLTKLLTDKAEQVVAVEVDQDLAKRLGASMPKTGLKIVNEDILHFDLTTLPKAYKLVANIPYYLTSNLIRVISESTNPPTRAVLLVQKEVAERLSAKPGKLSLLGVTAQYYWQTNLSQVVEAAKFDPPPKVDSQIVILDRRQQPLFSEVNELDFFWVVKAGFNQKRKKLVNSLSASLNQPREQLEAKLEQAGINKDVRAQELSLQQWYQLYQVLNT